MEVKRSATQTHSDSLNANIKQTRTQQSAQKKSLYLQYSAESKQKEITSI